MVNCGKPAHRLRPLSTDPGRQDVGPNQVQASFRLGTFRDVPSCDDPPEKHRNDPFVRCLLPKLSTTITRTRWFPARSTRLSPRAMRWVLGPTTIPGEGVRTHTRDSASACPIHLCSRLGDRAGDVIRRRGPWDRPLTLLSPLPLRFWWDHLSRLRVGPPGQEPPRPFPPPLRDQQRIVRSGVPSIDQVPFRVDEACASSRRWFHRAASGI